MRNLLFTLIIAFIHLTAVFAYGPSNALADEGAGDGITEKPGFVASRTPHKYDVLYDQLKEAIKANGMGHITTASATLGAKGAGIVIPGNRIVGVYNNSWARRMLKSSIQAGIEAPIRFYLTENADGSSTLSYKTPTHVFSPYFAEADADLKVMAEELDAVFQAIFNQTIAKD
ncbi:MAG: DUF302 domain-containing protein [Pseudomonadota bacterium]